MDRWEFRIGLHNQSKGVDLPFAQWGDKGIDMLLGGTSVILLEAEGWDSFPESPPMVIEAPLHELFVDWLDASFDLHGKLIDAKRFSPRQLYEALSQGWEYGWAVDGPVPQEPGDGDVQDDFPSVFEAAIATPQSPEENIQRGTMAMKHVISSHKFEPHAMFRKDIGWIAFYWGTPGDAPKECKSGKELKEWLENKQEEAKKKGKRYVPFQHGHGISHIIAKRDWEGRWVSSLIGQKGDKFVFKLINVIANGDKKASAGNDFRIEHRNIRLFLKKQRHGRKDIYLATGYEIVPYEDYKILESVGGTRASNIKPQAYALQPEPSRGTARPTHLPTYSPDRQTREVGATDSKIMESADAIAGAVPLCPTHSEPTHDPVNETGAPRGRTGGGNILFNATHTQPTGSRLHVGAADSVAPFIPQPQPQGKKNMSAIMERDAMNVENEVRATSSFGDILRLFKRIFGPAELPTAELEAYKSENSDYGLKVRGKQARAKLNAQAKSILERVDSPEELTAEDRAILLQYSGRGGTDDNSQYEYYTPTPVAEGMWEALKANGFENGNVLEPSCGAGVFLGTKPGGVVVSGNDIDPTSSKVARLLNPTDVVSNQSFESIAASTEDDTYDGVIGNVPFGRARGASMHEDPAYKHERRIERYFLLRILDKLKPGRLACLICPTNVLGDKGAKWKQFRVEASKKAEFLGAHKLPSKTFAAQGTDTVVDVLVFRKHPRDLLRRLRAEEIPLETLREAKVVWDEFVSGKYWLGEGRRFIHGTYFPKVDGDKFSRETVDGDVDGESLKRKIAVKFHSRIDWEMLGNAEPIERPYANGDTRSINGEMWQLIDGTWQKMAVDTTEDSIDPKRYGATNLQALKDLLADNEGALTLNLEQAFAVFKDHPELMNTQQKDAVQLAMGQASDDCREQIYRGSLLGSMIAKMGVDEEAGEDVSARRLALQSAVVAEVEKYGHPANNKALSLMGASSKAFGVFKNSIDTKGRFSDLLAGRLDKGRGHAYNADDVADVVNHLSVHRDEKAITLEDLKALYTGNMVLESLGDVSQVDELAITPAGTIEPLDVYCSGDVAQKVAEMQNAMGQSTDPRLQEKMQKQIDYLLSKMKHTKAEDITFGLRHKWFSKKYIVEFLRANGYPDANYCVLQKVKSVDYDGRETEREEYVEDYDNPDGEFLGLGKSGFEKQFADYLVGKKITSSQKDKIEQYRKSAAEFEEMFDSWMKQHPEIDELESDYNLRFNGFVPQEYSSTELEEIKDVLSGEIVPHSYQNAEVRRLSNMGSGICGFGVGLGKSFTALAMAAYNAKKGRAKRTCLVVPSAVLENWYHESRTFYNEAYMRQNVLFVGLDPKTDKEGNVLRKPVLDEQGNPKTMKDGSPCLQDQVRFANTPAEIYDAMWKIPQSNYKLVVMTKEKFQTIPLRRSTMVAYTQKMVDRHLMSSKAADGVFKNDAKKNGKKSYADDVKQSELEGRFSDERTQKKQELPYLEDMGFDSIITDESHFFKNSLEGGKDTQGIAFLPTAPTSAIAVDMNIKSDYIRSMNGGRGVYGLTATPVTNSPIEIFNMLSLVAPIEEFERFNVRTVDDFVRQFGKIENKPRMNVATDIKEALCLTGFENLDGLRNLFAKYVNIKTVDDVDSEIHVPNAEEEDTEVPITEEQEKIYQGLRARARAIATQRGGGKDSIFSVMRDMDRTTTDMDMYLRQMTFIFPEKHREAIVKMVPKLPTKITVKVTNEETGEKEERDVDRVPELYDEGATLRLVVDEAFDSAVVAALAVAGVPIEDVSHPISPKYAKLIENCRKHMEMQGKQLIFTEEKTQHQKIARLLTTQLPIKLDEIGIINAEDAAGAKLDQISKAYNAGGLKIVVANKKAEVGVNLQKGTTAIHHLTLPWTPASINQRNGRGVRQGNKADTVKIYYYCGKGTFDSYRKQLLKGKSNWINTLLTGKETSVENGDMAANEEMLAVLSGNLDEYRKRKAVEEAKRQNKAKMSLVNKLQRLISIKKNLENIEERKAGVKHDLTEQRDKAERDAHRLEARLLTATSEEERKEIQERLTAAKRRAGKKNADLNNLDAKFDAERVTLNSNKNAVENALRVAAKKGDLPFEEKLIDNPENCVVSLEGEIFSLGDTLELLEPHGGLYSKGIYRVERVDAERRRLYLTAIVTSGYASGGWVNSSKLLSPGVCQRCSYSESELNMKSILAKGVDYAQLAAGRIDKQTFLDNLQQIEINDFLCIIRDASGVYQFAKTHDTPREQIVYPEPSNADFRKGVFTAYLAARREGTQSTWQMEPLMRGIFGSDWEKQAVEYGNKATPTEISTLLARLWGETEKEKISEQFLAGRGTEIVAGVWENLLTITLREFAQAANGVFREKYDNDSDFSTARDTFVEAKRQEIRAKAEAIALAKRQSEEAKLREHPDFKEVPEALAKRFAELGLTVRYNTKPATLGGRKQVEYAAFARLFLKDSAGFGGRLYTAKEILKSRFKATFTKEWSEGGYGSAWWHVPATIDPRELYELLA